MSISLLQNIVGDSSKSDYRIANLAESINMYQESQGSGASASVILRSILGTELFMNSGVNRPCRGLFSASRDYQGKPVLFAAFGTGLYVISKNSITGEWSCEQIYNALTNLDTPVSMCETGGEGSAHPHLIVVDGASVITVSTTCESAQEFKSDIRTIVLPYRAGDKTLTQRIVPTHCAYLYGYLVVNDSSTDAFYTSYQYPFETTIEGTEELDYDIFMVGSTEYENYGFVTYSEWSPDNTTALISNNTLLYTFGPKSSQIFTYTSDYADPWHSPTNAANGIGILAVNSLAKSGDLICYLGSSERGENGVYVFKGNSITKISTTQIERQISRMSNPSDAVGQIFLDAGHTFYCLSFLDDDITLCYDFLEGKWHRRATKDAHTSVLHYWRPQFAILHLSDLYFGTPDGKIIKQVKSGKFTEYDDRPIIRKRVSGCLYSNYQYFAVDKVTFMLNCGDYDRDVVITPKIDFRWAIDNGNFNNTEQMVLGITGQYDFDSSVWDLGIGKIFTFEISTAENIDFAIIGGKVDVVLVEG